MADENDTEVTTLKGQVTELEKQVETLLSELEKAGAGESSDLAAAIELQGQLDQVTAKQAELTASLEKAEADKKAADEKIAKLESLSKMSDEEKEYCKGMGDEEKSAFMAKSPDDRKKEMGKRDETDETLLVGARTIRKSVVGDDQFAVMKAQQEEILKHREEIAKERNAREMAELSKRADAEYAHVPGSTQERASMLQAIDKMDESLQKAFLAVFTQSEALAKGAFDKIGIKPKEPADKSIAKQAADFMAKADEIRTREKISRVDSIAKARKQYPDLFKSYQEEQAS